MHYVKSLHSIIRAHCESKSKAEEIEDEKEGEVSEHARKRNFGFRRVKQCEKHYHHHEPAAVDDDFEGGVSNQKRRAFAQYGKAGCGKDFFLQKRHEQVYWAEGRELEQDKKQGKRCSEVSEKMLFFF